jgi:hypothetical protein
LPSQRAAGCRGRRFRGLTGPADRGRPSTQPVVGSSQQPTTANRKKRQPERQAARAASNELRAGPCQHSPAAHFLLLPPRSLCL